jgi:hypothetical protein
VLLILGAIFLAVLIGFAAGGRLRNLSASRIRWPVLAVVGLLLQVVPGSVNSEWPFVLLMASFAFLFAFALLNRDLPGFWLIVVGIVLNAFIIGINHGMAVTQSALAASDQSSTLGALVHGGGAKHHLAGAGDHLVFLADVIPVPNPIHQVLSVGDVFTYAGVMWFVVASMRRPARKAAPAGEPLEASS